MNMKQMRCENKRELVCVLKKLGLLMRLKEKADISYLFNKNNVNDPSPNQPLA